MNIALTRSCLCVGQMAVLTLVVIWLLGDAALQKPFLAPTASKCSPPLSSDLHRCRAPDCSAPPPHTMCTQGYSLQCTATTVECKQIQNVQILIPVCQKCYYYYHTRSTCRVQLIT